MLSVVIAVACLITGRLRGAVLAVAAVPVAVGLCEVLIKPLVHRTYIGQVVYPSGHAATIFALAATVTVLLLASPRPVMPRPLRMLDPGRGLPDRRAVVIGVIAVRFHYFTDTVAGAAVGIGTVCALALVLTSSRRAAVPGTAPVRGNVIRPQPRRPRRGPAARPGDHDGLSGLGGPDAPACRTGAGGWRRSRSGPKFSLKDSCGGMPSALTGSPPRLARQKR